MFSARLQWGLQPNPVSRLLSEKRTAVAAILDLTESNPTRAQLIYPEKEILAALSDERSMRYEPVPAGLADAREAVAKYYAGCVEPGRIVLTASTSEAYSFAFKLLTDPGDEVLFPALPIRCSNISRIWNRCGLANIRWSITKDGPSISKRYGRAPPTARTPL